MNTKSICVVTKDHVKYLEFLKSLDSSYFTYCEVSKVQDMLGLNINGIILLDETIDSDLFEAIRLRFESRNSTRK